MKDYVKNSNKDFIKYATEFLDKFIEESRKKGMTETEIRLILEETINGSKLNNKELVKEAIKDSNIYTLKK